MKYTLSIEIPAWLKSKIFWIAILTVLIEIGNSTLTSTLFPGYVNLIAWIVGILGFISSAISGAKAIAKAQAEITMAKDEVVSLRERISKMESQAKPKEDPAVIPKT